MSDLISIGIRSGKREVLGDHGALRVLDTSRVPGFAEPEWYGFRQSRVGAENNSSSGIIEIEERHLPTDAAPYFISYLGISRARIVSGIEGFQGSASAVDAAAFEFLSHVTMARNTPMTSQVVASTLVGAQAAFESALRVGSVVYSTVVESQFVPVLNDSILSRSDETATDEVERPDQDEFEPVVADTHIIFTDAMLTQVLAAISQPSEVPDEPLAFDPDDFPLR